MAKVTKDKVSSSKSGSASKAETKESSKVMVKANERLVQALQGHDEAKSSAKSYLIDMATICQEEMLSKEEIVASIMEARGLDRKTAGEQFSRVRKILTDPDTLAELRDGTIDLQTARARTVKKQKNPSTEKAQANAEKVITKAITQILGKAKELGLDLASIISTLKLAAKKAGVK